MWRGEPASELIDKGDLMNSQLPIQLFIGENDNFFNREKFKKGIWANKFKTAFRTVITFNGNHDIDNKILMKFR